MSRSIYWKITIPLISLVLLAMGILGYYIVNSARNTQIDQLESELFNEAKLVADISVPFFTTSSGAQDLDAVAKSVGNDINTRVTLIAIDGTVLGDSEHDPSTMENHATRPEVLTALASGMGRATRHSATLNENMMYVAVPVTDHGKLLGIARVALPLTSVNNSINSTIITVVGAMAIATVLVILSMALLARTITRPVRQITDAAEAMASGNLEQQIPTSTNDEIGRLGHAFNKMSVSVKTSMAEVADERSRLAAILSTLTDGVVMTDASGKIVLANPAAEKLFNFKEAKVAGRPLIEALPDHEIDNVLKKCLDTVREHNTQIDSLAGRFLRVIAVPITTDGTKGALILFQDLTELRNLQTMRREFVGNISHELRTPLAAIKAMVDTLRDGAINDPDAAVDFLNRLDVEVDGMTQMVSELTELTRIETGKIKLNLEPVNLNHMAEEVIARLCPQAERKQISFSTELLPQLPDVLADRERIRQVIMNIVHNAVKFTPSGGNIKISTGIEGQSVVIRVSDTGIGISRDDLPHIFERFFKADKSRSSSGSGLGLAIAKHTVQIHGGKVWVESEEGKGSTFGFDLPLTQDTQIQ